MTCPRPLLLSVVALPFLLALAFAHGGGGEDEPTPRAAPDAGSATTAASDRVEKGKETPKEKPRESASGPCAAEMARLQQRKEWLQERMQEQVKRGFPAPQMGVPNTTGLYCDAHPTDEQCRMGPAPAEFTPDELSYDVQKTPEDRDPHVIGLKRALDDCLRRNR